MIELTRDGWVERKEERKEERQAVMHVSVQANKCIFSKRNVSESVSAVF